MDKKIFSALTVWMLFFIPAIPSVMADGDSATIIYVDDDNSEGPWDGSLEHPYQWIQEGVKQASDGDTVFVFNGRYYQQKALQVRRSITLTGENRSETIVEGDMIKGTLLFVWTDNITISGFTFQVPSDPLTEVDIVVYSEFASFSNNVFNNINHGLSLHSHYISVHQNVFVDGGLSIGYNTVQLTVTDNRVNGRPLLYVEGSTDVTIDSDAGQILLFNCQNIAVTHQDISQTTTGIRLCNSHHCVVNDNRLCNNSDNGIELYNSHHCTIQDNHLCNNRNDGIRLYSSCDNNSIMGNFVSLDTDGIFLSDSCYNTVSNNHITQCETGIDLDYYSQNNRIVANNISYNEQGGIILSTGPNSIEDNVISSVRYPGIALYNSSYEGDSADYTFIQGNFISNCSRGISARSVGHCDIVNNTMLNNRYGIEQYDCFDMNISANTLLENTRDGIILSFTRQCHIRDNQISDSYMHGVHLKNVTESVITRNKVGHTRSTSISSGICLEGSSNTRICNNSITNNWYGIHLEDSSLNVISRNSIQRNIQSVFLERSIGTTITSNTFRGNSDEHELFVDSIGTLWYDNYWNRPRILPVIIHGSMIVPLGQLGIPLPWLNVDLHPRLLPYNWEGGCP